MSMFNTPAWQKLNAVIESNKNSTDTKEVKKQKLIRAGIEVFNDDIAGDYTLANGQKSTIKPITFKL